MISQRNKKILIGFAILVVLIIIFYYYTYVFANKNDKVIYQDASRRIYLIERKKYDANKPNREMWRMVYEDKKTGNRFFVLGNAPVKYKEKNMADRILNTIDKGKFKSYDQVDTVGLTISKANTDVHSNLVDKKGSELITDFKKQIDLYV